MWRVFLKFFHVYFEKGYSLWFCWELTEDIQIHKKKKKNGGKVILWITRFFVSNTKAKLHLKLKCNGFLQGVKEIVSENQLLFDHFFLLFFCVCVRNDVPVNNYLFITNIIGSIHLKAKQNRDIWVNKKGYL